MHKIKTFVDKMNTSNYSPETNDQDSVDIRSFIFRYLPYWGYFVASILLFLFLAFMVNRLSAPVYRVHSKVLISDPSKGLNQNMLLGELGMFTTRTGFHDQIIVLQSQSIIDSVLKNHNFHVLYFENSRIIGLNRTQELYMDAPFRVLYKENASKAGYNKHIYFSIENDTHFRLKENKNLLIQEQLFPFGTQFVTDSIKFTVYRSESFDPEKHTDRSFSFLIHDRAVLAREYAARLTVAPHNRDAWILDVFFEATHLQRAKDFVNTLTTYFVADGLREKNMAALHSIRFIDEQIMVATDSLFQAETSLEQFRQERQLTDVGMLAIQLMEELQVLDQQKAVEMVKNQYYEYLITYLERNQDFTQVFGPSAMGIEDRLLNELITEMARLYSERARLLLSTTERSPIIQSIDQKISQAKSTLEENLRSIRSASQILLNDLNRRIAQIERRIEQLPQTERELLSIQRRFNLNDATFNFLLEKRAEAGIAMASNVADNRIIDHARYYALVAPKSIRNYAIALFLGAFVPFAFLLLKDFFNTRITNKKEISDAVNFPLVGLIPMAAVNGQPSLLELSVLENPRSHLSEAFRTMRVNLQFILRGSGCKILTVTSTDKGEGKSFTSKNLASITSLAGKKTVLIGADMRKAGQRFGLAEKSEPGLSNYLAEASGVRDILQKVSEIDNLYIITPGPVPPNPAELLESSRMLLLLEELKKEFDFIVIDTPPVGMVPDAIAVMKHSDSTLYVFRQHVTPRTSLEFVRDFAVKANLPSLCIMLNGVDTNTFGYGNGYGYGYGYGYGAEEPGAKKNGWTKRLFLKKS